MSVTFKAFILFYSFLVCLVLYSFFPNLLHTASSSCLNLFWKFYLNILLQMISSFVSGRDTTGMLVHRISASFIAFNTAFIACQDAITESIKYTPQGT